MKFAFVFCLVVASSFAAVPQTSSSSSSSGTLTSSNSGHTHTKTEAFEPAKEHEPAAHGEFLLHVDKIKEKVETVSSHVSDSGINLIKLFGKGTETILNVPGTLITFERTIIDGIIRMQLQINDILKNIETRIEKTTDKKLITKNQAALIKLVSEVMQDGNKCITKHVSDMVGAMGALVKKTIDDKLTAINITDLRIRTIDSIASGCSQRVLERTTAILDKMHIKKELLQVNKDATISSRYFY